MIEFLTNISNLIENNLFIAPFLVFFAGILSSTAPCSLSSIPLIVGYIGGVEETNNIKRNFNISIIFALGQAITFAFLGIIASLAGQLFINNSNFMYLFLGILLSMMTLQILDIFNFIPSFNVFKLNTKRGNLGALLLGILGGFFSSPCSTPVLIVILGLITKTGNILYGALLMVVYSIGHNIIVVLSGTFSKKMYSLISKESYGWFSKLSKYLIALVTLFFSLYMFYLYF